MLQSFDQGTEKFKQEESFNDGNDYQGTGKVDKQMPMDVDDKKRETADIFADVKHDD